ncbi:MAG: HupE/UreJ family protein [Nitrospinae bacterium]|nr:HupE/UreJ family protein [Nitrospinota bacterium]
MKNLSRIIISALVLAPAMAFAHTGTGHLAGFADGFGHPFSGMDHMLAMVAVGIWAAQMGGRAVWAVPASFVGMMALGAAWGLSGGAVPFVEQGILLSVLVLGVLISVAARFPMAASMAVGGLFAVFHGHAHGTEVPAAVSGMAYAFGFAIATTLLHAVGIGFGVLAQKEMKAAVVRYAGLVIALCGVYLAV